MSENEITAVTSSGGPPVAAVSMSPTPLDVTVKIEKTESDYDKSPEAKVRMGKGSTLCQRVLQVKLTHLHSCLLPLGTNNAINCNSLDVNTDPGLQLNTAT